VLDLGPAAYLSLGVDDVLAAVAFSELPFLQQDVPDALVARYPDPDNEVAVPGDG
jgi:hypothetical protein